VSRNKDTDTTTHAQTRTKKKKLEDSEKRGHVLGGAERSLLQPTLPQPQALQRH